jgi:hypothetical protein
MVSSFEILLTILIIYFAARVTRIEERVNQLEANFNRHVKDGSMEESNTAHMGKAFGNTDTSFTGTVTDIAKGIKQSVDEVRR